MSEDLIPNISAWPQANTLNATFSPVHTGAGFKEYISPIQNWIVRRISQYMQKFSKWSLKPICHTDGEMLVLKRSWLKTITRVLPTFLVTSVLSWLSVLELHNTISGTSWCIQVHSNINSEGPQRLFKMGTFFFSSYFHLLKYICLHLSLLTSSFTAAFSKIRC